MCMPDESRVQELLDELFEQQATPEEVCGTCPELLPVVRARWRQICRARAELDALLPAGPDATLPAWPPEGPPLPAVPGYDVEAVLGHGGMGVVFRARHLRLNRLVALKLALAGSYAGPHERERLRREAEAVAALRHPNLVQVYDVGDADGRPYFTMEFVEGGSLAQQMRGTPQPARQAAALLATLAEAMHAAHQSGVVHRDLKPGNILVTAEGTPKVSDSGLARRLDHAGRLTRSGTPLGTPSYMAPEQAAGQASAVGPVVDVYALGAILYELLTGRPPFKGETEAATLQQVLTASPVPPSRLNAAVPRDLETICLKCLHKEPHLRYASAAALAEDLRHFLRGEAIAARPERWPGRLVRRVRRRPAFAAAVAAAALTLAGLAGGGLWLLSDRAAAARATQAERAATERAAAEDLRDMVARLRAASWTEARAALERARGRLGEHGSDELRRLLDQGSRALELAGRLEEIRLHRAYVGQLALLVRPDEYEQAFRGAGLGQVGDDPEAVAARVRASLIPVALVAALDHWSVCTSKPGHVRWVLDVARRADPDPTGWRDRARDPDVRADQAALVDVIHTAPVAGQSVPLLLALDRHLAHRSPERVPFLKKVQQAHPGDYWVNLRLGNALPPGEAIRYFQVAVAIRPRTSLAYHRLGFALAGSGRTEEAVEQYRRAVALDPTSASTHPPLATSLSLLGRHDEAIEQLRTAVRSNPGESGLRTALGNFLENAGRLAEALPAHQQAAALGPKNWYAQHCLRALLVRL